MRCRELGVLGRERSLQLCFLRRGCILHSRCLRCLQLCAELSRGCFGLLLSLPHRRLQRRFRFLAQRAQRCIVLCRRGSQRRLVRSLRFFLGSCALLELRSVLLLQLRDALVACTLLRTQRHVLLLQAGGLLAQRLVALHGLLHLLLRSLLGRRQGLCFRLTAAVCCRELLTLRLRRRNLGEQAFGARLCRARRLRKLRALGSECRL